MERSNIVSYSNLKRERVRHHNRISGSLEDGLWKQLGATYSDRLDRQTRRANFIIPVTLTIPDARQKKSLHGVILNVSASGMGVLSNDRELLSMPSGELEGSLVELNFDFFDCNTDNIKGRVVHLSNGPHPRYERLIGIEFAQISDTQRSNIHKIVLKYGLSGSC